MLYVDRILRYPQPKLLDFRGGCATLRQAVEALTADDPRAGGHHDIAYRIDNPTECSGPPHLLGPWVRRFGAVRGPHDAPDRSPFEVRGRPNLQLMSENTKGALRSGRLYCANGCRYLILICGTRRASLATGSYFFFTSLSVMVREFFRHVVEAGVGARNQLHL